MVETPKAASLRSGSMVLISFHFLGLKSESSGAGPMGAAEVPSLGAVPVSVSPSSGGHLFPLPWAPPEDPLGPCEPCPLLHSQPWPQSPLPLRSPPLSPIPPRLCLCMCRAHSGRWVITVMAANTECLLCADFGLGIYVRGLICLKCLLNK